MNIDDIRMLLDQFRTQQRSESSSQEIKRQWWNLTEEAGQQEFIRDIAAMANADTEDDKIIIIGVKGDRIYNAPLPEDEAQLQTRLQHIEPRPRVRFTEFPLDDGQKISLVEVLPPFDKPYCITSQKAKQQIPLRRGSTIGSVTRRELDHWYKTVQSGVQIELLWQDERVNPGGSLAYESEFLVIEEQKAKPERRYSRADFPFEIPSFVPGHLREDPETHIKERNKWISIGGFGVRNAGKIQLRDVDVRISVILDNNTDLLNRRIAQTSRISKTIDFLNPDYSASMSDMMFELEGPCEAYPLTLTVKYRIGAHTGVILEGEATLRVEFTTKMITMEEAKEMAKNHATAMAMSRYLPR